MPVQGLSRDAELLAQVADLSFSLPHCRHRQAQLGGGHLERPTTFPTARPRRGQARYCALCDQLALEFGQCGEDAEDQFASSGRRVDGRTVAAQQLETDATPSQIVHGVDQMAQITAEPIELPHDQRVALAQRLDAALPCRAPLARARHLLDEDVSLVDAGRLQRVNLHVEALV